MWQNKFVYINTDNETFQENTSVFKDEGVPVESKALSGQDSLLSIVQMPGGIPVGTLAIGKAGAKNAGLMAAAVIALNDDKIAKNLDEWRAANSASIAEKPTDNV